MEFGIQFFPDVGPAERSGRQYWHEALEIVSMCDELGYGHVRTVEPYFHPYGGYSPNPIVFLSAAAMRTGKARLVTGTVLPVFNNPLKLAGEIGMLDAISDGRLEVGFARAFLPHEFARFGVSVNESRARFEEGIEQVRRLLEEENVTIEGKFHSFKNVTSLPRPTQKPRPPTGPRGSIPRTIPTTTRSSTRLPRKPSRARSRRAPAWVSTPESIVKQILDYQELVGGFESASMQINFNTISIEDAKRSVRLFAREVMPRIAAAQAKAAE